MIEGLELSELLGIGAHGRVYKGAAAGGWGLGPAPVRRRFCTAQEATWLWCQSQAITLLQRSPPCSLAVLGLDGMPWRQGSPHRHTLCAPSHSLPLPQGAGGVQLWPARFVSSGWRRGAQLTSHGSRCSGAPQGAAQRAAWAGTRRAGTRRAFELSTSHAGARLLDSLGVQNGCAGARS